MKALFVSLVCLHLGLFAFTQPSPQPRGLSIGDTIPDLTFTGVYNHTADTLRLSDYRSKLVILDFWNTSCISCVLAFPKLDSLQREYGDRIQIFAVSKTDYQETANFFKKYPKVHRPSIPFITGDTLLANLFPHRGDPYYVWISAAGQVLHQTSGAYLTRDNLNLAIDGIPTGVPSRAPYTTYLTTLLDTVYDTEIIYASYLVRQNSTKNFLIEKRRSPNEYTVSGDIQTLYQSLYRWLGDIPFNPFRKGRTQVVSDQPERYVRPTGLSGEAAIRWSDEHSYFYQGRVPLSDSVRLFNWVKTDFDRYFDIHSAIERQVVNCWTLVRTDSIDRLRTQGGKKNFGFHTDNIRRKELPPVRTLNNYPYSDFSSRIVSMVEKLTGQPCYDETGYAGNIDVAFQGETLDRPSLSRLREELQAYGLDLVLVKKELDILVLRGK